MEDHRDRPGTRVRGLVTLVALIAASYVVALVLQPAPTRAGAQEGPGAQLYADNCAACHQAGGEGIVGTFPPLAGNPAATDADYVASTIRDGLSGPLDVLGVSYDAAMPAVSELSEDEITAVSAFVVELAGGAAEPAATPAPIDGPSAGDADRGHDLFTGSDRFDRGGAACSACHVAGDVGNLGGWSLGPDLSDVYARFGGETGLSAWLANPPSETMLPLFGDRPLADDEIADLTAFLADAPNRDEPADAVDWLTITGLIGLVVLVGGMAIAWRGMRQTYVETLRPRSRS